MKDSVALNFQVIVLTWQRKDFLRRCLHSLMQAGIDFNHQLILIINGRDTNTVNLLENEFPELGYEQIEKTTPAEARNHAIKQSCAKWLYFIDDDSWVESDYFNKAKKYLNDSSDVAAFGGPDLTPTGSTVFQSAIGKTLTSPLATATTRYRHKSHKSSGFAFEECDEKKLILCNLWINRIVLEKYNLLFPSELQRNEENLLLFQLSKFGEKLFYTEELQVFHERSNKIKEVFRKSWLSGFHRIKSFLAEPSSIDLIFFVPGVFVLYLLSLIIINHWVFLIPLFVYFLLVLVFSFKVGDVTKPRELITIMALHGVINIGYGLGSLTGLIKKEAY